jgi:flavin reductase (DIM6/NTAB) family NADH-FMN oxidoreductase RutF
MGDHGPLETSFRQAMRRLTATVTVVTIAHGSDRNGMTATAVTSVSMAPPALLVCVNRAGYFHQQASRAERFCVNVLHRDQKDVSQAFSRPLPSEQRFACGLWEEDEFGLPHLADAQASIFCHKSMHVPYGSHSIIVGEVYAVRCCRDDISPLLYQDGGYAMSGPLQDRCS